MFTVAKRKSLFNDKPVEIQELTYIIKQDINSLNKQIAELQEVKCGINLITNINIGVCLAWGVVEGGLFCYLIKKHQTYFY